jgi:hypothetical protein
MAKQTINIGTAPNDGTGTPLRTAFDYCNLNFTELYTAVGPSGNNIVVPGSATITGDLTVDTNTLFVDSTNNRVGIGTASPGYLLDAQAATAVAQILSTTGTNAAYLQISNTGGYFYLGRENSAGTTFAAPAYSAVLYAAGAYPLVTTVNGGERYRIASDGVATWSNVGGVAGTAMTLNATGLGVGGSPASKLYVYGSNVSGIGQFRIDCPAAGTAQQTFAINGTYQGQLFTDGTKFVIGTPNSTPIVFRTNLTEALTIDASQNVGVGVTPSAWGAAFKPVQLTYGSLYSQAFTVAGVAANCYNAGAGGWTYFGSGQAASRYEQSVGTHAWYTAAAGTGAIGTFTQAMTLDASGNLLVGTTSNSPGGTQSQFVNEWSGSAKWGSTFNQTISSATPYTHIAFCTNGTVRGSIDANNTTITYGTVSDYRLKENVQPISNALTRIAALKPSTYKWKDSGTDGEGFIAHELASVVPLAVIGQKDALNEDGTIKAQQIDLSKVVPILVAAIKELTARVEALEA